MSLKALEVDQPLGTPASEWAQQTVQAISPGADTGLVTDAAGNPTTDHGATALGGTPGPGINADKTPAQLDVIKSNVAQANDPIPLAEGNETETPNGIGVHAIRTRGLYTDAQGNPTADFKASALEGTPGAPPTPGYVADSTVTTPGVQLPGGWIRGAESRTNSVLVPQTSLYEDVSTALGTVGQAAFSAIPASVIGNLSNSPPPDSPEPAHTTGNATEKDAPESEETTKLAAPAPGLLSRAQGMLSGLLARPTSPAQKLPVPDAPTTTGGAALVGGGAIADTANKLGDNIASGQALGGHDPKGVLADEPSPQPRSTKKTSDPLNGANTATRFLDPDVPTPDPSKPPKDPGVAGSLFPILADDPTKNKAKGKPQPVGTTLSPDSDVQAAARKSDKGYTSPVPGSDSQLSETDRPQPTVTKVSDTGVKERFSDIKDLVSAPFAGSRSPQKGEDTKLPEPGAANIEQSTKTSGNAEAIRTTENPHTPHTSTAPPRDDGTDVSGTRTADPKSTTENGAALAEDPVHVPGVSTDGEGDRPIVAHEDGVIKPVDVPHPAEKDKGAKSGSGSGFSKLWSRSRTSVDTGRRASVDEPKSPTGTRRVKSRFTEEGAAHTSEIGSTPSSPASSRIRVPLKDKIKGELKIISGKMSKNETKVEQGIALKTGHPKESSSSS